MKGSASRRRRRDANVGETTQERGQEQERQDQLQPQQGGVYKRPRTGDYGASGAVGLSHPFRADFNDHFETSMEALQDIMVVVEQLRQLVRPSAPENFAVYDPYYCAGGIVQQWKELGVQRVLHDNRDFYKDVAEGTVPRDYDMLVTNPPFSGDHIERMFDYLLASKRPFAFLVPDYTATKEWYRSAVRRHFTPAPPTGKGDINAPRRARPLVPAAVLLQPPPFVKTDADAASGNNNNTNSGSGDCGDCDVVPIGVEPFYLVPRVRYDFKHPKGVGNEHSHFRSMWFVWAGRRTTEVLRGAKVEFSRLHRETMTAAGRRAVPDVVHGLDALAEGHYVQAGSRPNPQRRAKHRYPRQ